MREEKDNRVIWETSTVTVWRKIVDNDNNGQLYNLAVNKQKIYITE